jgi:hypothetical protein
VLLEDLEDRMFSRVQPTKNLDWKPLYTAHPHILGSCDALSGMDGRRFAGDRIFSGRMVNASWAPTAGFVIGDADLLPSSGMSPCTVFIPCFSQETMVPSK